MILTEENWIEDWTEPEIHLKIQYVSLSNEQLVRYRNQLLNIV